MKIRTGFVSNSSSSSFTFAHKDESIENLYKMIKKYNQYFQLRYRNYKNEISYINEDNVINSIKELGIDPATPITWKIDDYLSHIQYKIDETNKLITKRLTDEKNYNQNSYLHDHVMHLALRYDNLMDLKEQGFKTVHIIEFGDNHGHILGEGVGEIMDYEGRYIYINKDDFFVVAEQYR